MRGFVDFRDFLSVESVRALDDVFFSWKTAGYELHKYPDDVHVSKDGKDLFFVEFVLYYGEIIIRDIDEYCVNPESCIVKGKIDDIEFIKSLTNITSLLNNS